MTAQSKVSYRMESTLESVNKAEEMADRVGIMHQGRLVAVGAPAELRLQARTSV